MKRRPLTKSLYEDMDEWTEEVGKETGRVDTGGRTSTGSFDLLRSIHQKNKERLLKHGIGYSKDKDKRNG